MDKDPKMSKNTIKIFQSRMTKVEKGDIIKLIKSRKAWIELMFNLDARRQF